jgi:hypothetical protein
MEVIGPFAAPYGVHGDDSSRDHGLDRPDRAELFQQPRVSIYGSSNEIQRNIITKAVLGLSPLSSPRSCGSRGEGSSASTDYRGTCAPSPGSQKGSDLSRKRGEVENQRRSRRKI